MIENDVEQEALSHWALIVVGLSRYAGMDAKWLSELPLGKLQALWRAHQGWTNKDKEKDNVVR